MQQTKANKKITSIHVNLQQFLFLCINGQTVISFEIISIWTAHKKEKTKQKKIMSTSK